MLKRLLNIIKVELSKTNKRDEFQLKLLISKKDAEKYGLDLPKTRKKGIVKQPTLRSMIEGLTVTVNSIDKRLISVEKDIKDMKNTPTMKRELKEQGKS